MKKTFTEYLVEAAEGPRIPHPEDSIFDGSSTAVKHLAALRQVITNPSGVSIKWDGGIALIFGRNDQGVFVLADKYMPTKGVYPTSPDQWVEYDRARGANRQDLYEKINGIWAGLEQSVGTTKGLFKGDLMHYGVLEPIAGNYIFKPTTVEYHVPVNSPLGNLISGKIGIIVVHQYNGMPWDGKSGITNRGNVAVIDPKAGINFQLSNPADLVMAAERSLAAKGKLVDQFLSGIDKVAREAIKTYFNKRITKQTQDDIDVWLSNPKNISGKQYKALIAGSEGGESPSGYLVKNKDAYTALVDIWNNIYRLKTNLVSQLEQQVKGFKQYINGQVGGEGFVFPSQFGLIKLVDREVFGAAHFSKTR